MIRRTSRKATFRVGDRVRAIKPSWGDRYAPIGALGTVAWCPNYPAVLPVTFDGFPSDGGYGWAMFDDQIEHAHGPVRRALRRLRRG